MTRGGWIGRTRATIMAAVLLVLAAVAPVVAAAEPVVAAAADLKFALEEVAQSFRKDTGQSVKLAFGSSGTFATQIRHGAPFEMYLSADEDYVLEPTRTATRATPARSTPSGASC